jgi:hypothetical protein
VRDAGFAGELRAGLAAILAGAAREVRAEEQQRLPWQGRLARAAAYSLVRFMLGVTRYAGKQYAD